MRVLYVVASPYWVTAEVALQIIEHNPQISGLLCSVPLLNELFAREPHMEESIDLVHFMVPVAGRRYLPKFRGRLPCVSTIYHLEPSYSSDIVAENVEADAVMVMARMWREELVARGVPAERIFLLPVGVDTKLFRPAAASERFDIRHRYGFDPDDIVIGFSGSPSRDSGWRKGIDVFIDALKIVWGRNKSIGVVVGGPGWDSTLQEIQALGIKAYQRQYAVTVDQTAPMYRALDFYWVASRIEGGPLPLLEAMSSAVCCISSRVGMAPDVITDGTNGFIVDIEDPISMAKRTEMLIGQEVIRRGIARAARETIANRYDSSITAKRAPRLYEIALARFMKMYSLSNRPKSSNTSGIEASAIISPQTAAWLHNQEQLIWARELSRIGERRAAMSFGWKACIKQPFSTRTWSFLSRLFLPDRIGKVRNMLSHK